MAKSLVEKFYDAIPAVAYTGFAVKLDYLPSTPVECISLVLDITGNSSKYFGQKTSIDTAPIVMTVRSASYSDGMAVSEAIRDYFNSFYNSDFLGITAKGAVISLGKDLDGNRQFMVYFTITVKE